MKNSDELLLFDTIPVYQVRKYLIRIFLGYLKHDPEVSLEIDFQEMIDCLTCLFDYLDELEDEDGPE